MTGTLRFRNDDHDDAAPPTEGRDSFDDATTGWTGLLHLPDLFQQYRDKLLFPDLPDNLPLLKQHPGALSSGDADIRFGGLPGAVDDAAHEGDLQGCLHPPEFPLHPLGQTGKIDLAAAAGRTGDDVRSDLPDIQRPQNSVCQADLRHGIAGDGDPDRVADAVIEQGPDADGGFDGRLNEGSRLRDAEMKRIVGLRGDGSVGLDHGRHIGRFQGELDRVKAHLFQDADVLQGALHQGGRRRSAVADGNLLLQGTGIDSDPDDLPVGLGNLHDLADSFSGRYCRD